MHRLDLLFEVLVILYKSFPIVHFCYKHFDGILFDFFFFQAEDGIRDRDVTGVQTCALPIFLSYLEDLKQVCRQLHAQKLGAAVYLLAVHLLCAIEIASHSHVLCALPRKKERSEEHTSELQSHHDLVCRLLLEKKKYKTINNF